MNKWATYEKKEAKIYKIMAIHKSHTTFYSCYKKAPTNPIEEWGLQPASCVRVKCAELSECSKS